MIELFKSIWNVYNTSTTFKTALTGGFHYGKAPQNCAMPYAVYSSGDTTNEDTFDVCITNIPIQINIYTNINTDVTACFTILKACKALYKNRALTVTSAFNATLAEEMVIPPINLDGIKWMAVISFNCLLQETQEITR